MQGTSWSLVLPGTQHLSFSDVTLYSPLLAGGEDVVGTQRVVNAFTLAFFNQKLRNKVANPSALQAQYPNVRFRPGNMVKQQ